MKRVLSSRYHLPVLGLLGVAAFATLIGPREKSNPSHQIDLGSHLPEKLGDWTLTPFQRDLSSFDFINEIYEGFFRNQGQEIVFAIEYGSDFGRKFELHLPEDCHRVRGDFVMNLPREPLFLPQSQRTFSPIFMEWESPSRNVAAVCGYWLVIDGRTETNPIRIKLNQFSDGIFGRTTPGLLVRIDAFYPLDPDAAQKVQGREILESFILDLDRYLSLEGRRALLGS